DVLASVNATDPQAAASYLHLAGTAPEFLRPEHAWLYGRAAQQYGLPGPGDLDLFARIFGPDPGGADGQAAARAFYAPRQWDIDEVEYTYLEHAAAQRPGEFPAALGPDYAPRGEDLLLGRSNRLEEAGQADAALASALVLLKLAPRSARAHDQLARLHYR